MASVTKQPPSRLRCCAVIMERRRRRSASGAIIFSALLRTEKGRLLSTVSALVISIPLGYFGGIGAALTDAQAGLLLDNKPALYQLGKAVGIFKIPEALVALLRKVLKVNGRDYARQPAKNKQYQNFYIKLFMNKAQSFHNLLLKIIYPIGKFPASVAFLICFDTSKYYNNSRYMQYNALR